MNATVGREGQYERISPAGIKKKVMVVGAGPAGMEAARVSALRGHTVSLYEKSNRLGGQINLAIVPPHKGELKNIIDYFSVQLSRMKNLEIKFGVEVTRDLVQREKPDVVIIATGAVPFVPHVKSPKGYSSVTANAILAGKAQIGKEVVIAGGGMVGCETANYVADRCERVTIVEMIDEIAYDVEALTRMCLLEELSKKRVSVLTNRKVCEVKGDGCFIIDKNWNTTFLNADTLVFTTGSISVNALKTDIAEIVPEVFVIGDAKKPRRIIDANSEGYLVAYHI
jgi:NADPH-dependent 2,4-dienoyl-CoA reductase/sulfur reductase-like enzyme